MYKKSIEVKNRILIYDMGCLYSKKISQNNTLMTKTHVDINVIRNFPEIDKIYEDGEAKGRTWGVKGDCYHGSHITFFRKEEMVILYQAKKKDSKIFIASFTKDNIDPDAERYALRKSIVDVLQKYGIIPEEG